MCTYFQDFSRLWDFERQWKLLTMQWRTSKTFFASEQHSEVFSPKEYKGRKKELTFQQKSWKRDDWSIHFTMGQKMFKNAKMKVAHWLAALIMWAWNCFYLLCSKTLYYIQCVPYEIWIFVVVKSKHGNQFLCITT